jgi:hypothetical protein
MKKLIFTLVIVLLAIGLLAELAQTKTMSLSQFSALKDACCARM